MANNSKNSTSIWLLNGNVNYNSTNRNIRQAAVNCILEGKTKTPFI